MSKNRDLGSQGTQATTGEMQAGTETAVRGMSPALVSDAITALAPSASADKITSAVDIELTAASEDFIHVDMTVQYKNVFLPDATTLSNGRVFTVSCSALTSSQQFALRTQDGTLLHNLTAAEDKNIKCTLLDNSTEGGLWNTEQIASKNDQGIFYAAANGTTVITKGDDAPANLQQSCAIALDSARIIVGTRHSDTKIYLTVFNIKGSSSATEGTGVAVSAAAASQKFNVEYVDTDKIAIFYSVGSVTYVRIATISDLTITLGTEATGMSFAVGAGTILSPTSGVCVCPDSSTGMNYRPFTISGTTVTLTGSDAVLSFTGGYSQYQNTKLVSIDSTTFLAAWTAFTGSTYYKNYAHCTLAGTTVTAGTLFQPYSFSSPISIADISKITATKFLVTHSDYSATYTRAFILTLSGTTWTAGANVNAFSELGATVYYKNTNCVFQDNEGNWQALITGDNYVDPNYQAFTRMVKLNISTNVITGGIHTTTGNVLWPEGYSGTTQCMDIISVTNNKAVFIGWNGVAGDRVIQVIERVGAAA